MITQKLTFADAPEVLFKFEQHFFSELKGMNVEGWNLWQLCKVPIFYTLIRESAAKKKDGERGQENKLKKTVLLLKSAIKSLSNVWGKGEVILLTNTADKLSKNEKGIYYNSLVDPVLDLGVIDKPLIIEQPGATGFLMPASHPWHIDRQLLDYYAALKRKFFKQRYADYTAICDQLTSLLNSFLSAQNYTDKIRPQLISDVVSLFVREFHFFTAFFKRKKPRFVLGSECMGTGVMAAALELKIPFVELQHGSIDQYYPPYIWDQRFLEVKNVMKPSQLWVFGSLAKEIAIATGFFSEYEVKPIGYKKIDDIRAMIRGKEKITTLSHQVLVVVQPMMHEFNKKLVKVLLSLALPEVEVLFKVHPLQPTEEIKEYESMMLGSKIRIVDKTKNIHSLILKSDVVVGHVTTCLEEALSLEKPSMTIATSELPAGLHSMTGLNQLIDIIKPITLEELDQGLTNFYGNSSFRNAWSLLLEERKNTIYSDNYNQNIANALMQLSI